MDKPWKVRERKAAALIGGVRVGPAGKNTLDVKSTILGLEVKARANLTWGLLLEALGQAARAIDLEDRVPGALLVSPGQQFSEGVVAFRVRDFELLHGRLTEARNVIKERES